MAEEPLDTAEEAALAMGMRPCLLMIFLVPGELLDGRSVCEELDAFLFLFLTRLLVGFWTVDELPTTADAFPFDVFFLALTFLFSISVSGGIATSI